MHLRVLCDMPGVLPGAGTAPFMPARITTPNPIAGCAAASVLVTVHRAVGGVVGAL